MKTGIEIKESLHWHWIVNHDCPQEKVDIIKEEIEKELKKKVILNTTETSGMKK